MTHSAHDGNERHGCANHPGCGHSEEGVHPNCIPTPLRTYPAAGRDTPVAAEEGMDCICRGLGARCSGKTDCCHER